MLNITILTAYPEMFPGGLAFSLIGKALKENKFSLKTLDLHEYGFNDRNNIDDDPFGGGPGMLIRPDVIERAILSIDTKLVQNSHRVYLTPSGEPLKQSKLINFSKLDQLIILCGHFEGVDQRAIDVLNFEEISIGDYVLSGGEIAAQVLVEGCIRLIPGVLGQPESLLDESFSNNLLEHPHFTRPKVWRDAQAKNHEVPNILVSGNHEKIKEWRNIQSVEKTKNIRPDLFTKYKQD